jgi:hypothetical protein
VAEDSVEQGSIPRNESFKWKKTVLIECPNGGRETIEGWHIGVAREAVDGMEEHVEHVGRLRDSECNRSVTGWFGIGNNVSGKVVDSLCKQASIVYSEDNPIPTCYDNIRRGFVKDGMKIEGL